MIGAYSGINSTFPHYSDCLDRAGRMVPVRSRPPPNRRICRITVLNLLWTGLGLVVVGVEREERG